MSNSYAIIDRLLDDAVARGVAAGLAAIVGDRDAILYEGQAGLRDPGGGAAMTGDTIFWLASCTKLVTSIAALQLVERGLLALDTPIDDVLPDLAGYRVLAGIDADGAAVLRVPARPVTLRHLLTHTAGFGYDMMNPELLRARGAAGPPASSTIASLRGPLLFDPGEGWAYGNCTDWVGLAVEAVSGQTLDAYFQHEIFAPLGMHDTGFDAPSDRGAQLCARGADGGFVAVPSPVADRNAWEYISGGGGLFGTLPDYLRLLQAVLGGGRSILGEAMAREIFIIHTGPIRAGALASVVPEINAAFDLFPRMATGWSLGGMVNPEDVPCGRRAGSLGWAGLANTYYWADPAAGRCAVLSAQHLPFAEPAMIDTLRAFERTVYAVPESGYPGS